VLVVVFLLVACGGAERGAPPPFGPSRAGPLASMSVSGGLCPDEPCDDRVVVDADGAWQRIRKGRVAYASRLGADQLDGLRRAVAASGITAGSLPAFTGTCPTAYDGIEVTYVFEAPDGAHSASSCTVRIPADDPAVTILEGLRAAADAAG
jgi:hypothetical protein